MELRRLVSVFSRFYSTWYKISVLVKLTAQNIKIRSFAFSLSNEKSKIETSIAGNLKGG